MARYYSLCLATPTKSQKARRSNNNVEYEYLYPAAGQGYLFHDSDGITDARQVHKALWILSGHYPAAKSVFLVRIDDKTVMGSFNTNSFPQPVRVGVDKWDSASRGYEWLQKNQLRGWFIEDIRKVDTTVTKISYDALYDRCPHLERMVGSCPCPRQEEGTCFADTVFQTLPALEDNLVDFGQLTPDMHNVSRYKVVDGYEFVPGLYSVEGAFVKTIRPWDNYEFGMVESRRNEFRTRGSQNRHRNQFRKEHCSACVFQQRGDEDEVRDCGYLEQCQGMPVDNETAEKVLDTWAREHTPFFDSSEGFTRRQIMFLVKKCANQFSSRAFVKTGTSMATFAGFTSVTMLGDHLAFRIVPETGDLNRQLHYYSYADMVRDLPGLPPEDDMGYPYCDDWMLAAVAALSTLRYVPRPPDGKMLKIHHLDISYYGIEVHGINGRRTLKCLELSRPDYAKKLFRLVWPGFETLAHVLAETPMAYPKIGRAKPDLGFRINQ